MTETLQVAASGRTTASRREAFVMGARDTIPLIIGAVPFGFIFGAVAVTGGLSPAAAMGFSLFVFAGSAQFIAAGLVAQGVGIALIVVTTFVVNQRHALYSVSLAPYLRRLSGGWLALLSFLLTDETYAVTIRHLPHDGSPHRHYYQLGSSVALYVNWQLCTAIGIVAGTQLQGMAEWGLEFAMVATFIGIVVPMIVSRPMVVCAVVAGVVALLAHSLPNQLGLMVGSLAGILAGYLAEQWSGGKSPGAGTEGAA